ncbi:hypothetical protein HanIR_Chr17g0897231 [Helianthus annuus]|nr:hypothetical protein HanIR_Chr17g0897231 [Helianthus annuus]
MGLSSGDGDHEMKEGVVIQLKDDSREDQNNMMIENVGIKGIEIEPCFDLEPEFDFWPIQHPTEPSHEDRPVQCPMPHSSHLISDDRMQDDRFQTARGPKQKPLSTKKIMN